MKLSSTGQDACTTLTVYADYSCLQTCADRPLAKSGDNLQVSVSHRHQLFWPFGQTFFARFCLLVQTVSAKDEAPPQQQLYEGLDLGGSVTWKDNCAATLVTQWSYCRRFVQVDIMHCRSLLTDLSYLVSSCQTFQDAP